jgi:HSP20 family protein
MRVDLPGVDPKNIDVAVASDTLTIRASRERRSEEHKPEHDFSEVSYGRFERSASLPRAVNRDQIKASYQNGVLELTMPASPEWAGRRIPVEMGTDDTKRLEHQAA